jgi:Ca2+-binding EF-hand superfamily protein
MNRAIPAVAACLLLAVGGNRAVLLAEGLPEDLFASSPADEILDVVILAEGHPIVVRYRITIGGVGHRLAFGEFVVRLHAYLDADHDGILSAEESDRGAWTQLFADQPFDAARRPSGRAIGSRPDLDGDGRVSLEELGRHLREALEIKPLEIAGGSPPDPRTERPFEHLDRDGDGRLDADEIARAPGRLAALDRDQDEWVTLDEMNPYSSNTRRFFGGRSSIADPPSDHPFVVLDGPEDRAAIAGRMLDRYDRDGDGRLDAGELGLPGEEPDPLDPPGLARWLEDPAPHLEFRVEWPSLGSPRRPATFERVAAVASMADLLGEPSDTPQGLDLGPMAVELGVGSNYNDYRSFLLQNFEGADGDDSGALDRSEAGNDGNIISRVFDAADRDGDGSFSRAELISYMDMYEAAFASRLSPSISDLGRSVFQSMDPDGDLRLSLREVLGVPGLLSEQDRDGDGAVVLDEFPRRYQLSLGLGPGRSSNRTVLVESSRRRPASPAGAGVPSWFTRMDRNGDGDVSRREFLGPLDLFDGLDRDGDGLVSSEDAARPVR